MSFVYSSNSPEFLNYLAHSKTRNDILNDPRLCILLEDPHIKDNMELALLYREAQYGDYEKKKEFIGFLLANGPELDTDTIIYYREKILHNPTYTDIYIKEFKYNMDVVDDLRINTYKKDTTDTNPYLNCLSNPCDYLGPFSSSIGIMADDRNFNTITNFFSSWSTDGENFDSASEIGGSIAMSLYHKLLPDLQGAYNTLMSAIWSNVNETGKALKKLNSKWDYGEVAGDKGAWKTAKETSTAVRVNIVSNLGDCYRVWESMRRLRQYDPSKNNKNSFTQIGPKTGDGTQGTPPSPQNNTSLAPMPGPMKNIALTGVTSKEISAMSPNERFNSLSKAHRDAYTQITLFLLNMVLEDSFRNDVKRGFSELEISNFIVYIERIDNYLNQKEIHDGIIKPYTEPLNENEIPEMNSNFNTYIGEIKHKYQHGLTPDGEIDIIPGATWFKDYSDKIFRSL